MAKLTVYHVVGAAVVVTLGLLWMWRKVRKVERRMDDLDQALNAYLTAPMREPQTAPKPAASATKSAAPVQQPTCPVSDLRNAGVQMDPICETMSVTTEDVDAIRKELHPMDEEDEEAEDGSTSDGGDDDGVEEEESHDEEEEVTQVEAKEEAAQEEEDPFVINFNKTWRLSEDELKKKTVEELRQYLKSRGLPTTGAKQALIHRILEVK